MNALQATGESSNDSYFIGNERSYWPSTQVHSGRLSTYDVPYEKSAAPSKKPSARSTFAIEEQTGSELAAQRYALSRYLAKLREDSVRMRDEAARENSIETAICGAAILDDLRELWRFRNVRETEWGEIVNFLQSALAKEPFEKFTVATCDCVLKVISEHLAGGAADRDDVRSARRVLKEAGLDPWKAISSPAEVSD